MLAISSKNQSKSYQDIIDTYSLKRKIEDYIEKKVNDLEEEGSMCYEMCLEENDFHMTTYWLPSIYEDSMDFIKKYCTENYAPYLYGVAPTFPT